MFPLLTNTLIKIFSRGFYRANSGLLIFICVTLGSSFFYIETAGDIKLLTPQQLTFFHFIVMITFITSPLMTIIIFCLWFFYSMKSWSYVAGQLTIPQNQFLLYSVTSMRKWKQFGNWFSVQLIIFAPLIVYWIVAVVAGIVFHQYLLPAITLLYILILTSCSAWYYTFSLNRLSDGNAPSYFMRLSHKLRKSYFSLFLYQVFENLKLAYFLTKVISFITLIGVLNLFGDTGDKMSVASIVILLVITAHSYLVYQEHAFTENKLSFSRNLPYSRVRLFLSFIVVFLLLLLPEVLWLFVKFNPATAIAMFLLGMSVALLFRSLLYWFGLRMFQYVGWIFGLYILLSQLLILCLWSIVIPLNAVVAFVLFYRNYYKPKI